MYVCMYVCMYTMILPLHFSVPIYSPWQKKKKKKKKTQSKKKEALGPCQGPNLYLVPHFTNFTKNTLKTRNFDYP